MVLMLVPWTLFLVTIYPFLLVEASVRVMSTNETLLSQTSDFGPRVGAYGVLAHVYEPLDDARGCHLVRTHDTQWIALLRRGGCSFAQKVYTMQQSGAIAVIVGDQDTTEWITMSSEDTSFDITIPSVFLPQSEYQQLLYAQQKRQPLLVLLEDADKLPRSTTMDTYFCLMIPLCPVLLVVLLYVLLQQRKHYKRSLCLYYEQQQQLQQDIPHTLNEKDLERCLPRHYTNDTLNPIDDTLECAICLDHFDQGSEYRSLACRHIFHTACIDPWLMNYKSSCPVCSREPTVG